VTIATCYVSPEGVVLGADSTSTVGYPGGNLHFFNFAQKLFEIGEDSTLAAVTWGLGGLVVSSHRMHLALLADDLKKNPPPNVQSVATRWSTLFWNAYQTAAPIAPSIQRCKVLSRKPAFDANAPSPNPSARTQAEEEEFTGLKNTLTVGFCIAGYVLPSRESEAFELIFDPLGLAQPVPAPIPLHNVKFWGAPNVILRLIRGYDDELRKSILASGKWGGSEIDLDNVLQHHNFLGPAVLPIRDAIDLTYSCIASTIKALKFSHLAQICGGPIEIAVITSDRRFRWVRHKSWDAAIIDGEI
jgi:hypothetical protein